MAQKLAADIVNQVQFLFAVSHSLDSQITRSLLKNMTEFPIEHESADNYSHDNYSIWFDFTAISQ
jgi:hypothetical protein